MTTPPRHFKEEIQAWLDQRLDAATCDEAERHLETCEECRREFEAVNWVKQRAIKKFAPTPAPAELRENILRSLRSAARPEVVETPRFVWPKWKLAFATAAILVVLGALTLVLLPKRPGLLDVVAGDFQNYQSKKLALELNTGDVKEMETFFTGHGIQFNPRVFDLGMMNYRLVGGRVQPDRTGPAALFVYRGPDNQTLHCRMYAGNVATLPAGATTQENKGIQFHVYKQAGLTMVFWQEGAVVCVLSSDIPGADVVQLAFAKAMLPGKTL